jgi:4-hydroxy-3-polyprenylbenzoate decarboxylase
VPGATGVVLGGRLLANLARIPDVETHLVLSRWARATIELETGRSVRSIGELAGFSYSPDDQGASISSGSFRTDGMVIEPCSMKPWPAFASDGRSDRAADARALRSTRITSIVRSREKSLVANNYRPKKAHASTEGRRERPRTRPTRAETGLTCR